MFNKKNRLRKTKEIEVVFKNGRSFYDNILGFKVLKNNIEDNRFCVIISAKVSKKAVVRNKIKRQITAIISEQKEALKSNLDIIIIVNKNIIFKDLEEIKNSVVKAFKVLKIYV